jgi:tRNA U34 5-methylaminomethyl-2-thiouridine-forming methyltransferase MnmC
MERKIITTKDGSKTIHIPEWNESYHSQHGALQEAMHVFIQSGLYHIQHQFNPIHILEIGFGTGLNALLSLQQASNLEIQILYDGLEAFPITNDEWKAMNYTSIDSLKNLENESEALFKAKWNTWSKLNDSFSIYKRNEKLEKFKPENNRYHLIYFDAFGPRVQPEMWSLGILQKLFDALSKGGVLVTYCCKGQVRRDLITAGFEVEKIPGPPGKREMLRAKKTR